MSPTASAPIVETSYGKLRGFRAGNVACFRGVPFARPPSGQLRYRAPLPPEPWSGIRDATEYAPAAPQGPDPLPIASDADAAGHSEDCLTLNLWTPGVDAARRPVMVWIHGGSFLRGSASLRALDGARLAARGDVVIVSIQYRLGALGFLHLGEHDSEWPSNLALRDQIAALQWVRAEIGAFGGNPSNVTLFGQSAGAISIGVLLGTPAAQGLFDRAIVQSGPPDAITPAEATAVTESLLHTLQVPRSDLARLRELPVEQIIAAEPEWRTTPGARPLDLPFLPVIDGDLLPQHPLDAIRAGLGRNIPILVGTNLDEMTPFLFLDPTIQSLDEATLQRRCTQVMPHAAVANAIALYRTVRVARGERVDPPALWLAIKGDRYARHPSMRLAEIQRAHGAETYAYLFTWDSPFMGGMLGACHGLELPFVFGTLDIPILTDLTGGGPAAAVLSQRMQDAWIAFARGDGLGDWPHYDPTRRATMTFGRECGVVDAPMEEERRFWDGLGNN